MTSTLDWYGCSTFRFQTAGRIGSEISDIGFSL